jgi:hypothetical protein
MFYNFEGNNICIRNQAKDSTKVMVEQSEFDEELSEQEDRLPFVDMLLALGMFYVHWHMSSLIIIGQ